MSSNPSPYELQPKNRGHIDYTIDIGMPYGQMPNEALMAKFEETQDLVDTEDQYFEYAKDVARDRSPDPIAFEQNEIRKGYAAGGRLNLLHKGGRGDVNTPSHPEMFLGLTENEPRGVATDPNFNKMVDQANARMRFVRFSADADNSIHQGRPSESEMFKKQRILTQQAMQPRLKIFTTSFDGRREGLRRGHIPHKSDVSKTEEDMTRFRPAGSAFSDYITDMALNPQVKTARLSDTVLTNSRLYNQFTTDHTFAVSQYGETHRKSVVYSEGTSKVCDSELSPNVDIPGGDLVKHEDVNATYKAAGLLMGALVNQKHQSVLDAVRGPAVMDSVGESTRKTAALHKDLGIILHEAESTTTMGSHDEGMTVKGAKRVAAEHLSRVQMTQHTLPSHTLHNAELMFKSVMGTTDKEKTRREIITDDRKEASNEDLTIFGKKAEQTHSNVNMFNGTVEVDGKSMQTTVYKKGRNSVSTNSRHGAVATTEGFAGSSDDSQIRTTQHRVAANNGPSDVSVDPTALGSNYEDTHREVVRSHDRARMGRVNTAFSHDRADFDR